MLIQASRSEILRDDAVRMADTLRKTGYTVTLEFWDHTPHAWRILGDWMPEARARACLQTAAPARR